MGIGQVELVEILSDGVPVPALLVAVLVEFFPPKMVRDSDYRLMYLRRKAGERRVIPSGGPFNLACCPNLTGEIIEWIGFALLTWSLPGLAFALWTIANLAPRAVWRRDWYRQTFDDFPKQRTALVPGVL